MAVKYYLAKRPQINGRHPVHLRSCPFLTEKEDNIYLGSFNSADQALREGEKYYPETGYCRFCLKERIINKEVSLIEESVAMAIAAAVDLVSHEPVTDLYYLLN